MRWLVVFAAVSLIGGCASDSRLGNLNGRVSGHALAGPTCPVEQPGVLNCEPKPVQGKVQFRKGNHVVRKFDINVGGDFATEIPAGMYTVTVDVGDNLFPMCSPVEVEVLANVDTVVDISCDTGIR